MTYLFPFLYLGYFVFLLNINYRCTHSLLQTGGWEASMLLGGAVYFLAGLVYLVTVTAEVQEWNDYEELPSSNEVE